MGDSARTFIAQKNLEIKKFQETVAKTTAEEFTKLTERINACAGKIGAFKKDNEGRKRSADMQEATEKVSNVETLVKKLEEAVEPLVKKAEEKKDDAEKKEPE